MYLYIYISPSINGDDLLSHNYTHKNVRFLKIIQTLSCWYSLDRSHIVLSHAYPYNRVSVIFFKAFLHHFLLPKLASSIKVNDTIL